MLTQAQLEAEMYAFGRARASRIMATNEEGGRSNTNPYASVLYRRFVLPLAERIKQDLDGKKPGRNKAHVALLAPIAPEASAFIAVRGTMNVLLASRTDHSARAVCSLIGNSVRHEAMLQVFEKANPALFHTVQQRLDHNLSKSEEHRFHSFINTARSNDLELPGWSRGAATQVGAYLLNELESLGMVELAHVRHGAKTHIEVYIAPEVMRLIETVKGMTLETMPYFLPCIEPPKDWTAIDDGGWHTDGMRRMQPYAVASKGAWSQVAEGRLDTTLGAINRLQRVRWQINGRMLDTIKLVAKHFDMDEILSQSELPAPPKPVWLEGDIKKEAMSQSQLEEFTQWKRERRDWHTAIKLRNSKAARMIAALKVADKFREFPAIHFVYFADFRGRLYANTTGVNPQGSDMQKALLRFAQGKPLATPEAEMWFMCNGANRWGFDKASLADRVQWVRERERLILDFADDPVSHDGWTEADKPLQFLAWCQEYSDWVRSPHTFVSHIPVGMDGSCNGLQNFSAMLRDEVGGAATNLTPSLKPNDIYQRVADVTAHKLRRMEPDEEGFRDKWLAHGINRALVKRSVMTLPYGSTRFSCAGFIVDDYLSCGKAKQFEKTEYNKAAQYLSFVVWDAIGEVVIKAREAMDWLQQAAGKIIKEGQDQICWDTPTGFRVVQRYQSCKSQRIRTTLCGNAFLRLNVEEDAPDRAKHKNGIAPNFIHSYDAAHLQLTTVAAGDIDLAMIHDDYGTHAADAPLLARVIREQFVAMYEQNSPLEQFSMAYGLGTPPAKGALDLKEVLKSDYFFA